jgi:23S rRNA (adenine2503-C2)-methyltransferase
MSTPPTTPESMAADAPTAQAVLPSILDYSRDELTKTMLEMGEKKFRADQLWRSIYNDASESFEGMSTLSKTFRNTLSKKFSISSLEQAMFLTSADNTTSKALYRLHDGELIETVMMRYETDGHRRNRKTACISTQAGCALGCTFCATGQQGLRRNLTVGEIVAQVIEMQRIAYAEDEFQVEMGKRTKGELQGVTNVVFMGMGEPLANYENTMSAIRVLNDGQGLNIGARHITVSTVGLIPQILQLAEEDLQINLAISLHAPDNNTRSQTMPINDSIEQAQKLGRLLNGLHCHVNLIPVNPTKEGPFERTDLAAAKAFQGGLKQYGIPSTLRMEKGIDINAGCGQLRERAIDILGA